MQRLHHPLLFQLRGLAEYVHNLVALGGEEEGKQVGIASGAFADIAQLIESLVDGLTSIFKVVRHLVQSEAMIVVDLLTEGAMIVVQRISY